MVVRAPLAALIIVGEIRSVTTTIKFIRLGHHDHPHQMIDDLILNVNHYQWHLEQLGQHPGLLGSLSLEGIIDSPHFYHRDSISIHILPVSPWVNLSPAIFYRPSRSLQYMFHGGPVMLSPWSCIWAYLTFSTDDS